MHYHADTVSDENIKIAFSITEHIAIEWIKFYDILREVAIN